MKPIAKITTTLRFVGNHPRNRHRKFRSALEWVFIQLASRFVPGEICVEFPNQTSLLVPPRMKGVAFYISPGLWEFADMAFVMHFLRPGDVFFDVGANIGAFTVLAGGVAGAKVVAFEPSPEAFQVLEKNARLNQFDGRAKLFNAAAGRTGGEMQFTSGLGTENHIISGGPNPNSVRVRVMTLDQALEHGVPSLLKVDVEGFETEVFAGAQQLLNRPKLAAMIVERRGNAGRHGYGDDETELHQRIQEKGFIPCSYDPFTRQLSRELSPDGEERHRGDIIYVRDIARASSILAAAPPFKLDQLSV